MQAWLRYEPQRFRRRIDRRRRMPHQPERERPGGRMDCHDSHPRIGASEADSMRPHQTLLCLARSSAWSFRSSIAPTSATGREPFA